MLDVDRSVAFGQRAPNRATAREEGRGLGAGMKGGSGAALQPPRSPAQPRNRDRYAVLRVDDPRGSYEGNLQSVMACLSLVPRG